MMLNFRRIRGDIIETYKILSGKNDTDVVPFMNNACTFRTRGNDMRLQKVRFKYDLRKYCFTNRVVNTCQTAGLLQLTALTYLI